MDWLSASIAGGASLLGGIMGNSSAAAQAQNHRDFQDRMSSTAHKRDVADLRAAGLNHILSATGGSGASTPSGSTASQNDVITPAISSALSVVKTMAEAQKTLAEKVTEEQKPFYVNAQREQASSAVSLNQSLEDQAVSQSGYYDELNKQTQFANRINQALWDNPEMGHLIRQNFQFENTLKDLSVKLNKHQITVAEANASLAKLDIGINKSTFGRILRYLERGGEAAGPWIKAIPFGKF